ncbi:hypothetical protein NMT12_90108 [metagenome]
MGKLSRNIRICGDCGIVYTSVSMTKYIDECPICKSRRYEQCQSNQKQIKNNKIF